MEKIGTTPTVWVGLDIAFGEGENCRNGTIGAWAMALAPALARKPKPDETLKVKNIKLIMHVTRNHVKQPGGAGTRLMRAAFGCAAA